MSGDTLVNISCFLCFRPSRPSNLTIGKLKTSPSSKLCRSRPLKKLSDHFTFVMGTFNWAAVGFMKKYIATAKVLSTSRKPFFIIVELREECFEGICLTPSNALLGKI